jgi:ATP-dependent Lhr-like helicase
MSLLGPASANSLGERLGLAPGEVWKQFLLLEVAGTLMRGVFENTDAPSDDFDCEWCERRLLQRIHKRTLGALRKQVEPVSPGVYMQWLLRWQHVAPQTQLSGEQGLLEAMRGLEGFEAPAIEWERTLLPARVAGYDPRWLDSLCMAGAVGWGRVSPHPAFYAADSGGPRRVIPTSMAPVTFFLREEALWMDMCLSQRQIAETNLSCCLSELALKLRACLEQHGAIFAADFTRISGAHAADVSRALWELVAAGLVTADGFDSLRMLIDPRRKQGLTAPASGRRTGSQRNTPGRWSLLGAVNKYATECYGAETVGQAAERREKELASACIMLLRRYGVVFRDVLERESTIPKWRELLPMLRRMEARGEVRGGHFLSGFGGEQFALPEALASLREARRSLPPLSASLQVAAADPLNLIGIVVPGERVAALPGKFVVFDRSNCGSAITSQDDEPAAQSPIFATASEQAAEVRR